MVDDVAHRFNIPVPALQSAVVRLVAGALQRVSAPLGAGLEHMSQAGYISRQLRHLHAKAHAPGHGLYNRIHAAAGEMREVSFSVIDRRIAVQDAGLVPHGEDLVVDAVEFRHSLADMVLVQVRVLVPEFMQQRLSLVIGNAATGLPFRQIFQPVDDEFQLAHILHGVVLADLIAVPLLFVYVQRFDLFAIPFNHADLHGLMLPDWVHIYMGQLLRLGLVLGQPVENTPRRLRLHT